MFNPASLRRIRLERGMTQRDLSEAVYGTRDNRATVSAYERGEKVPRVATLGRFARALGCSMDDLTGQEQPEPDPTLPGEEWRPIAGTDGVYEVSNLGRVRSWTSVSRGQVIKPQPHQDRYLAFWTGPKLRLLHRVVLETFVGPRPDGMVCRHLDGDRMNCRLDNLRWGTAAENMRDSIEHGTHANARKTHCPAGHEYTPENTRIDGRGHRACRECARLRKRRRKVQGA
ncbi:MULTISPECIES: HNH endonuclease [unclassified Nocardiopsis]|uniref:HNH endonuclease n=1 Tax=Nocardiopsis TaxID=2013 RepID=UPI00387ADFD2